MKLTCQICEPSSAVVQMFHNTDKHIVIILLHKQLEELLHKLVVPMFRNNFVFK